MLKKFQFVVRKLIQLTDLGPAPKFQNLVKILASQRDEDRVEIYRPLIADPKEVRKQRAAEGKKMKKGGGDLDG